MDDLLRYASLAGAGLPAHERHKAKSATVRQMRRVQVESDGTLRFSAPLRCDERDEFAQLTGLTFSIDRADGGKRVLVQATDAGDASQPGPSSTPAQRKTRRLTLLSY